MFVCPNCSNEQESGKFCGVCGTALQSAGVYEENQQVAAAETSGAEGSSSQTTDKMKEGFSNYWHYILNLLKNPSIAFQTHGGDILNAVITLAIFAVTASLSMYFWLDDLVNTIFGTLIANSLPFFSFTFRALLIFVIFAAFGFAIALVLTKAAKSKDSAKTIFTQYGSLAVPFAAINVIAIITGLAGLSALTLLLLVLSNVFFFYFVPTLIIYDKANAVSSTGHKIYLSLAAVVIMAFFTYIINRIIISSVMGNVVNTLNSTPSPFL